ncbi:hypothetical protein ACOMHN_055781 [Nucella lapillus]
MTFVLVQGWMWYQILLFVNFCGVVSNAFLIAFTSSWGDHYSVIGKLIIVIAFEHMVFMLKYIVAYLIPDTPAYVSLAIRREQYQIQRIMEEPKKETDYAHLFPMLEQEDHSQDTDAGGDGPGNPDTSHTSTRHLRAKDIERIVRHRTASETSGKQSGEETPHHPHNNSLGGYVHDSPKDVEPLLKQGGDLWYCGEEKSHKSHAGNKQPQQPAGKFVTEQASDTDLFSSRHEHIYQPKATTSVWVFDYRVLSKT